MIRIEPKKLKIFGVGICCIVVLMINIFANVNVNPSNTDLLSLFSTAMADDEGWGQHLYPCGDFYTCRFDDLNRYCTNGSGSVCYCYCD